MKLKDIDRIYDEVCQSASSEEVRKVYEIDREVSKSFFKQGCLEGEMKGYLEGLISGSVAMGIGGVISAIGLTLFKKFKK